MSVSRRIKVYLTAPVAAEAQALLAARTDLDVGDESVTGEALRRRVCDADVIFSKVDPIRIDAAVMEAAPKLGLIARHGSGYSNVDVDHATARGVLVTATPGVNAVAIAEYTIGLMLLSVRRLAEAAQAARGGNPDRLRFLGMELAGKTLGIAGMGNIGKEVLRRAVALGMRVLAYHPRPSASQLAGLPLELVNLERLLAESDVISIHAPLTEQTRNLIAAPQLAAMKPTAHLLNLGRGGIVNEADVCAALHAGSIAGYATDVLEREPVSAADPLLSAPHAVVLPHIAAMTGDTQRKVAMTAVEDILRFARGEQPVHVVNPEARADAYMRLP